MTQGAFESTRERELGRREKDSCPAGLIWRLETGAWGLRSRGVRGHERVTAGTPLLGTTPWRACVSEHVCNYTKGVSPNICVAICVNVL